VVAHSAGPGVPPGLQRAGASRTGVRTPAELLADAAQLAATERTATWLDQLTDDGLITPEQRARIAAEDGAATLIVSCAAPNSPATTPVKSCATRSPTGREVVL